ncbi:22451_t:CDS:2 [Cetraspora pellucida]|uniref:22451_t:CDS:1 n=1 Tax=Cetraspora pellucida TaxID=1433469 RepID=A0A9N8VKX6_9GLOM|nr:22451_t:CDS:2 [Cetraspora pellucida]
MSGLSISIIIDKKDRILPKSFNNRPGYDMRYVEILEPKDLMQEYWDHDCNKPKTRDANNNTLDDMKFLGLTRHEVKNSQTREQFNQWCTEWIELYKNNPIMCSSIINRQYKEYYI